jgi:hypothetical protein
VAVDVTVAKITKEERQRRKYEVRQKQAEAARKFPGFFVSDNAWGDWDQEGDWIAHDEPLQLSIEAGTEWPALQVRVKGRERFRPETEFPGWFTARIKLDVDDMLDMIVALTARYNAAVEKLNAKARSVVVADACECGRSSD